MKIKNLVLPVLLILAFVLSACAVEPVTATPTIATEPPVAASAEARTVAEGIVVVTFIDVGQGDSTLIQTENGAMLIDGGLVGTYEHILSILRQSGISHLDYVVATHPHADHIGGLVPLIGDDNGIGIGTVLMPNVSHTTRTYENFLAALIDNEINVLEPYPGKIIELDDVIFTVIAPNSSDHSNLNNHSIVLIMDHGFNSFMFTADAEKESEYEILAAFDDISVDVLGVGHHGSRTSSTAAFLDAVSPRYAVISAGLNNTYSHPHGVVLERLKERDIEIFITFELGDIVMVSDGTTIEMR